MAAEEKNGTLGERAKRMTFTPSSLQAEHQLSQADRLGLYKTILGRRDVRGQFKPDPVPPDVLGRVLTAAHHAPSVGFLQPWNFLLIRKAQQKDRIKQAFEKANAEARLMFEGEKRELYSKLKLEGILEAPVNLLVTCDPDRAGPVVIGRTHIPEMDRYSSVCAVQNLWLAARAEGLGVGWVSIFDPAIVKDILGVPERIVPVAYLCLGYVQAFFAKPELESAGWRQRLKLEDLLYFESWGETEGDGSAGLKQAVAELRERIEAGGEMG
jgi:5,6-dimethylbenzimidazole synthase